jgi:hypothetical protein
MSKVFCFGFSPVLSEKKVNKGNDEANCCRIVLITLNGIFRKSIQHKALKIIYALKNYSKKKSLQ